MERKNKLIRYLPYAVAILLFAVITSLYFAPQFSGKSIRMHDVVQYEGAAKENKQFYEQYGEDPQWNGTMFSGMPASLIDMRYDSQIIKKAYPVLEFLGRPASFIFLAMTCFFVMLLMFRVDPWVGIIPSLAYGLSTYFFLLVAAGHVTKLIALAYAPLIVGAVYYTLRRDMWLGAALTALFGSLQIAANHPQITYYFGFVLLALWINEGVCAVRERTLARFYKATGMLAIAGILALGSNIAPLWYINEYSKESIRGGSELSDPRNPDRTDSGLSLEYATAWSYGKAESFNMFVPYLTGGSSEGNFSSDGEVAQSLTKYGYRNIATQLPSYWGDQPYTAGPTYIGAVVIFLFVLALLLLGWSSTIWVAAVSLLALLLSWGHNLMWFTEFFFNYFPGYNKFRTVSMILVIVQWTVPFLAAIVLSRIWKGEIDARRLRKGALTALAITGGAALVFALFSGAIFDFTGRSDRMMGLPDDVLAAMRSERLSMLRSDSWRSLFFVSASAAVLWGFARGMVKRLWLVVILAVLVTVDLVVVNLRFLPQSKFTETTQTVLRPTQADEYILQDKEPGYRVLNLTVSTFNDATTSYFHRSVGGYHGAKLQRYQDLIDYHLSDPNSLVYNILNTKYVITNDRETGQYRVVRNTESNGPAWFVSEIIPVSGPDQEIQRLGSIDNRYSAVVDRRFADDLATTYPGVDSSAYITLEEYRPNYMRYRYASSEPAVAVFSEIYYDKGWTAYVDGVQAPYFRADYVLRAMELPAGEHTVEFRFRAERFTAVSAVNLACSILILIAVVVTAYFAVRKCKRDKVCTTTKD